MRGRADLRVAAVLAGWVLLAGGMLRGQAAGEPQSHSAKQSPAQTSNAPQAPNALQASAADQPLDGAGQTLDSVVAVINGDVLLDSDIDEEMRFAAFQPYTVRPGSNTRVNAAERLIDRTLIRQQERQQPVAAVTDAQLDQRISELRKQIPACARYHCETDAGWHKFVTGQGFTEEQVRERWRMRMELLEFIEDRFRAGIKISQAEMEEYYNKELLPQFAKEKVKAPSEQSLEPRIEEILLQQKVSTLLVDWLQSMREQGTVHILDPTIANRSSKEEMTRPEAKPR